MDQVILTRFNLPSNGAEGVVRAREGWLADRVELFETYCLPSVLAQTEARFRWMIYFDPDSPEWLVKMIRRHSDAGYYVPIFRASVSSAELLADIAGLFESTADELLTTNLDNDDALAMDFVARLRAEPPPGRATAYYLTNGLILGSSRVYHHRDRYNAFASMRARWSAPITCWADWHNRLHRRVPVVEIGGAPGWLQVVHGRNVSNRIHGRLVSPDSYGSSFGDLLANVGKPTARSLVRDRIVGRPRRVARDAGRSMAKTAAMTMLGPSGFESAKRSLARMRRARPSVTV